MVRAAGVAGVRAPLLQEPSPAGVARVRRQGDIAAPTAGHRGAQHTQLLRRFELLGHQAGLRGEL